MAGSVGQAMEGLLAERGNGDPLWRDRWMRSWIGGRVLGFTNLSFSPPSPRDAFPGRRDRSGNWSGRCSCPIFTTRRLICSEPKGCWRQSDAPVGGEWQDAFLGTPGLRVGGGTDQIQRNIIAERILGLPKDPVGA